MTTRRNIDLTPDISTVTAIVGASMALTITLDSAEFTSATHTASAELLVLDAIPPVPTMTSDFTDSVVSLSLTSTETLQLAGTWGFAVWLTAIVGAEKTCIMRGQLRFEAP
jgi:hypothetical protein